MENLASCPDLVAGTIFGSDYGAMTDEELERAIGELGGQLEAP